jgi:hypothetical protein
MRRGQTTAAPTKAIKIIIKIYINIGTLRAGYGAV